MSEQRLTDERGYKNVTQARKHIVLLVAEIERLEKFYLQLVNKKSTEIIERDEEIAELDKNKEASVEVIDELHLRLVNLGREREEDNERSDREISDLVLEVERSERQISELEKMAEAREKAVSDLIEDRDKVVGERDSGIASLKRVISAQNELHRKLRKRITSQEDEIEAATQDANTRIELLEAELEVSDGLIDSNPQPPSPKVCNLCAVVDDLVESEEAISRSIYDIRVDISSLLGQADDLTAKIQKIGAKITEAVPPDSGVTKILGPFPGGGSWKIEEKEVGKVLASFLTYQTIQCEENWYKSSQITMPTSAEAFSVARTWIDGEAKKLQAALDSREKGESK